MDNTLEYPRTVTQLPAGYKEVQFLRMTQGRRLVWLNIGSIGLLIVAAALYLGWLLFYHRLLGGFLVIRSFPIEPSYPIILLLIFGFMPLHEIFHGLGMMYYGHKVRYGIKWTKGVLYATTDQGLFWREQFAFVALAPLLGISLITMFASLFVSGVFGFWLMAVATLNAAGAIGDVWMIWVIYHYPAQTLIRDEEDGMRIFAR